MKAQELLEEIRALRGIINNQNNAFEVLNNKYNYLFNKTIRNIDSQQDVCMLMNKLEQIEEETSLRIKKDL